MRRIPPEILFFNCVCIYLFLLDKIFKVKECSESVLLEPLDFHHKLSPLFRGEEEGTRKLWEACNIIWMGVLVPQRSTSRCHAEPPLLSEEREIKHKIGASWVGKSRASGSTYTCLSWYEQWASLTLYRLERRENGHTVLRRAARDRTKQRDGNKTLADAQPAGPP